MATDKDWDDFDYSSFETPGGDPFTANVMPPTVEPPSVDTSVDTDIFDYSSFGAETPESPDIEPITPDAPAEDKEDYSTFDAVKDLGLKLFGGGGAALLETAGGLIEFSRLDDMTGYLAESVGFDREKLPDVVGGLYELGIRAHEAVDAFISPEMKDEVKKSVMSEDSEILKPWTWKRAEDSAGMWAMVLMASESLPIMGVSMGGGGMVGKGLFNLAMKTKTMGGVVETARIGKLIAARGAPATHPMVKAGLRAEKIQKWGARGTMAVAMGASESAPEAASAFHEVKQDIMTNPDYTHEFLLEHSSHYAKYFEGTDDVDMGFEERVTMAKEFLADAAGTEAGIKSGIYTFALSGASGALLAPLFIKLKMPVKPFNKGKILGTTTAMGIEGGQEFAQGAAQALATNIALKEYADDTIDVSRGVMNSAVIEAFAGMGMGGMFGAVGTPTRSQKKKQAKQAGVVKDNREKATKIEAYGITAHAGLTETHGLTSEEAMSLINPIVEQFAKDQNINVAVSDLRHLERFGRTREKGLDDVQQEEVAEFGNLDVNIEVEAGQERNGITLTHSYGSINGTIDADGMNADIIAGTTGSRIFIVDKLKKDGSFEQHKVLYGFENEAEAVQALRDTYSDEYNVLGDVTQVTHEELIEHLDSWSAQYKDLGPPSDEPLTETDDLAARSDEDLQAGVDDLRSQAAALRKAGKEVPKTLPNRLKSLRYEQKHRQQLAAGEEETTKIEQAKAAIKKAKEPIQKEQKQERQNRVENIEESYRLPNLKGAVPEEYLPEATKKKAKTVIIYRSVPKGIKEIRAGDWVALDKKYAKAHERGELIEMEVPADHVAWAGTDMNEYFYVPRETKLEQAKVAIEKGFKEGQKISEAATKGHRKDQPGLRGHTVGEVYPFIVMKKGSRWRAQLPDSTLDKRSYKSSGAAEARAVSLKKESEAKAAAKEKKNALLSLRETPDEGIITPEAKPDETKRSRKAEEGAGKRGEGRPQQPADRPSRRRFVVSKGSPEERVSREKTGELPELVLGPKKARNASSFRAVHYGKAEVELLEAGRSGEGIRGEEKTRLSSPTTDPRIRRRAYFYIEADYSSLDGYMAGLMAGRVLPPEQGLGRHVYGQNFGNIYNTETRDPRFAALQGNEREVAIVEAGYDGYAVPSMGMLVILNYDVPVKHLGTWQELEDQGVPARKDREAALKDKPKGALFGIAEEVAPPLPATAKRHAKALYDRTDWSKINPKVDAAAAGAMTSDEIQDAIVEYTMKGTSSKWFRRWFGESKAVDGFGQPIEFFHGSPSGEIEEFKRPEDVNLYTNRKFVSLSTKYTFANRFSNYVDPKHYGPDSYTDEMAAYESYGSQSTVYPVYVRAEKLFDFRSKKMRRSFMRWLKAERESKGAVAGPAYLQAMSEKLKGGEWSFLENNRMQRFLKERGYDAFYMIEAGALNIGVFDPLNIKSSTGNAGTFSRSTTDTVYSLDDKQVGNEISRRLDLYQLVAHLEWATTKDSGPKAIRAHIQDGLDRGLYSQQAVTAVLGTGADAMGRAQAIRKTLKAVRGTPIRTRQSIAPKVLEQEIKRIIENWKSPPEISIHANYTTLPDYVVNQVNANPNYQYAVEGLVDPFDNNRVHIIANNIGSIERLHRVFTEESLGHYGLRLFFGNENLDSFLDEVMPDIEGSDAWNSLLKTYTHIARAINSENPAEVLQGKRWATEELIAKQDVTQSVWERFMGWFRQQLRAMGLITNYTENDIRRVMSQVHARVIRGTTPHAWGVRNNKPDLNGGAHPYSYAYSAEPTIKAVKRKTVREEAPVYALRRPQRHEDELSIINEKIARSNSEMTVLDRVSNWLGDIRQSIQAGDFIWGLKQGTLDDAASVERWEREIFGDLLDAKDSAYKAIHTTKNLSSVMAAIAKAGIPEMRDGVFQAVEGRKGFIEMFRPLYEHQDGDLMDLWEGYAAARRANELIQQTNKDGTSREKLFSQEQIDKLLALGDEYAEFSEVFDEWQKFNNQLLDLAVEQGVLSTVERDAWADSDYIPFFRAMEAVEGVGASIRRGTAIKAGVADQSSGIRRLTGGEQKLANLTENMWYNTASLIDKIYKNHAMSRVVDMLEGIALKEIQMPWEAIRISNEQLASALKKAGLLEDDAVAQVKAMSREQKLHWNKVFRRVRPTAPNVVGVMREGKMKYYEVEDEMLLSTLKGMGAEGLTGMMKAMGMSKSLLTRMVTIDPAFMMANWMRDTISAWVTSDANFVPVLDSIRAMGDILHEKGGYIDMMMSGSGGGGFYDLSGGNVTSAMRKELSRGRQHWGRSIWQGYKKLGAASENSNRLAIANRILAKGGSLAEAMYQAQDIMNFTMSGDYDAVKFLIRVVPFMNARMQGLYRLARGARDHPVGFTIKGMALMAATFALLARNWDDDDYERLEGYQKDINYNFFVDGDLFIIPKPFEVGLIFSTIPERLMRSLLGRDDLEVSRDSLLRGVATTLAFNPVPQLFKPILEQYANWNIFLGRNIENMSIQRLEHKYRATPYTSQAAQRIGRMMPDWSGPLQSPARIQHIVRAYIGTVGLYTLSAADALVRLADKDLPPMPERKWYERPVLSRFIKGKAATARYNKYTQKMYDVIDESNKAQSTFAMLIRQGRLEEAKTLMKERRSLINPNVDAETGLSLDPREQGEPPRNPREAILDVQKKMRELSKLGRDIMASKALTPEEKRRMQDNINRQWHETMRVGAELMERLEELEE